MSGTGAKRVKRELLRAHGLLSPAAFEKHVTAGVRQAQARADLLRRFRTRGQDG